MRDSHERAWEITSLLSIRIKTLDDFVLNDTTAGICSVVVGAETDLIEATHADLNSALDLANIVGPAVGTGDS